MTVWRLITIWGVVVGWGLGLASPGMAQEKPAPKTFLIGNSLTWDTVPGSLSGDVQWHVDCGVSLPQIFAKPDKPCVASSTLWPAALREKSYDFVTVQPFYGSTLDQDVEAISEWMKLQPKAVFVIHSGWARHALRANEFASYAKLEPMVHSPGYFRALIAELRRLHPGREIRQTFAQELLAVIADEIAAQRSPWKDVAELYRDDIHMTHDLGKYLMHNAMRRALGQPPTAVGFDSLPPERKAALDGVLARLSTTPEDRAVLLQIVSVEPVDRKALIARLSQPDLRDRLTALLPEMERAVKSRPMFLALEDEIKEAGGKVIRATSAPAWLLLATGDTGLELFDVPVTVDLNNGNNPLKGRGGRNERVTDEWLQRLAGLTTLKRLDLGNCAVQGAGLKHITGMTELRELNLTLCPATDEALRHLGGLAELRNLGLASTQCTGTGFVHLKGLRKLESVNLHFTPVNDEGLQAISQVTITGRLWFAHTRFTDAGATHLVHLTQLKRCGIGSADKASTGEAVASLRKLPLEDLSLLDNQATPAGLAYAAQIATLRRLDASHAPDVQDESLTLIARMPVLEEFQLGSAQVTDSGLQALAGSKSLKKIVLSGLKKVTPAGVDALRAARPECEIVVQ